MKRVFYIFTILVLGLFLIFGRRYIYSGVQYASFKIGLNFNNLSKNSYVQYIKSQPDDFIDSTESVYLGKKIEFRDIVSQITSNFVLGESTEPKIKTIDVNLKEQRLYLKENETVVGNFQIASGKWAPTPTGSWPVWGKVRYSHITGGSKVFGTFYDLPNVPYNLYFNNGYAIQGSYWLSVFGQKETDGSIDLKPEDAGVVYNWAEIGTNVTIHD